MRYVDGPSTHREVRISAGPACVWEVRADVEAMTGWSPELVKVEWLEGATSPAAGTRYIGHNEHQVNGSWRTVAHFTELEPGRTLIWCVLDIDGRYGTPTEDPEQRMSTWSFTLTPDADGVVLRQSAVLGPGRCGLNASIERAPENEAAIIAYRFDELGKGMDDTLQGIKDAAER